LPVELEAYRSRQSHAKTKLIVVIDVDTHSIQQRLMELDQALQDAEVRPIDRTTEEVARLLPKRNIETWILCLNDVLVDEETDYKRTRNDWTALIRTGAATLYELTRPNAQVPGTWITSLQAGIRELRRLDFRA
jgi:hypothetical protein